MHRPLLKNAAFKSAAFNPDSSDFPFGMTVSCPTGLILQYSIIKFFPLGTIKAKPIASIRNIPNELKEYAARARPVIKIHKNDLLPGSQNNPAFQHRNRKGSTDQCGAQMGITVPIVPGIVMMVAPLHGSDRFQHFRNIFKQPGFIFHGTDGSRGSVDKNQYMALPQLMLLDKVPDLAGQIDNIRKPFGMHRYPVANNHFVPLKIRNGTE